MRDSYRKYFLPRVDITDYNVLIDGRNFYDQPIKDQIRNYNEIRKIATVQGDDLKWLAHLVSQFACNTIIVNVIVDARLSPPVSIVK